MPRKEIGLGESPDRPGSKSVRAGSDETKSKIGSASFQVQGEFFNTLQEMSRDWMACATASSLAIRHDPVENDGPGSVRFWHFGVTTP